MLRSFSAIHRRDMSSRLVIAPRRVERARDVARMVQKHGLRCCLWSDLVAGRGLGRNGNGHESRHGNGVGNGHSSRHSQARRDGAHLLPDAEDSEVLVVDSIGDLPELMALGDAVYVGGSLVPFGGHNVIEPALVGCPVVTGPHYESFRRVVTAFLEREAVLVAANEEELLEHLCTLKSSQGVGRAMAQRAGETIAVHSGASRRTLEALRPLIEGRVGRSGLPVSVSTGLGDPRSGVNASRVAVGARRSAFSGQTES